MRIDARHRLREAEWQDSPHFDDRPSWAQPELLVLHCVSLPQGQYGTGFPQALFRGELDPGVHPDFADLAGLEVAPHIFIDRAGGLLQFVAFDKRAWHAGQSVWSARNGCNAYSIGIELEGSVEGPYTAEQYAVLLAVCVALIQHYPALSPDAIVGHSDIAPARKTDPGPYFDWQGVQRSLHRQLAKACSADGNGTL